MNNKWKRPIVDAQFVEVKETEPKVETAVVAEPESDHEVLCGVVLKRCPVISYNKWSHVLVYERDGELIQTNSLAYNGEGYVEVE